MATEADKQNIAVIGTIVGVGGFAMIAVSLAVTAMVRAEVKDLNSERSSTADLGTVRELKAGQRTVLGGPAHWSDRSKGLVAIPIDRAMQLVAEDLRRNPRLATPYKPGTKAEADAGAGPAAQDDSPGRNGSKVNPDGANTPAPPSAGGAAAGGASAGGGSASGGASSGGPAPGGPASGGKGNTAPQPTSSPAPAPAPVPSAPSP